MEVNFKLEQIKDVASNFIASTSDRTVFALHGDMGAGKTTFIHAVCEALGVHDNISSPTFSIINQYTSGQQKNVYHIDLYRLADEAEAIGAGVEDCLYSGNICFVEWPDRAPGIFPDNTLHLKIEAINDNTRRLTYEL